MNEKNNTVSGGIGFIGVLQIVFIVLKLCGVIEWNWVFVMMPMIISAGITLLALLVVIILLLYRNGR